MKENIMRIVSAVFINMGRGDLVDESLLNIRNDGKK